MSKINIAVTLDLDWLNEEAGEEGGFDLEEYLKDEIASMVVGKISQRTENAVVKKADDMMQELLNGCKDSVKTKIDSILEDYFDTPKNITDRWGNVTREGVTTRMLIAETLDAYFHEAVNEKGVHGSAYDNKYANRVEYLVRKSMDGDIEYRIKNAVGEVIDKLKQRVTEEVKRQMGEKLASVVGLDDIISGGKLI
jgi:hypothetical protein